MKNVAPLKINASLKKLCEMFKTTESQASKLAFFSEESMEFAVNAFINSNDPLKKKDPRGWCFAMANEYCNKNGNRPDWTLYKSLCEAYKDSHDIIGDWKNKKQSSNEKKQKLEEQTKEYLRSYKLKCEARSAEYMAKPGSYEKAKSYGKYPFFDDMRPTESINLTYEEMSQNYITARMVASVGKEIIDDTNKQEEKNQLFTFEDGQPIKPDYGAIFDSLDEIDESQMEEVTFIVDNSQTIPTIGNMLQKAGLF